MLAVDAGKDFLCAFFIHFFYLIFFSPVYHCSFLSPSLEDGLI